MFGKHKLIHETLRILFSIFLLYYSFFEVGLTLVCTYKVIYYILNTRHTKNENLNKKGDQKVEGGRGKESELHIKKSEK